MAITLDGTAMVPVKALVTTPGGVQTNFGYVDVPLDDIVQAATTVPWTGVTGKPAVIAAGATIAAALTEVGLTQTNLAADSTASDVATLKTYVNALVANLVASGLFTQS